MVQKATRLMGTAAPSLPLSVRPEFDAVIVGSGPNGLAAAITLVDKGLSVLVLEGAETVGGGVRTQELTLPGLRHDVCSAIHPLAVASPFFRSIDLTSHGLEWIYPPAALAHPLDHDAAVLLERSTDETAQGLGDDADAYRRLINPLVQKWDTLVRELLKPLGIPRHPLTLMRFGSRAMRSARAVTASVFTGTRAQALFAGNSAHSILPLETSFTASFGLMLSMLGHAVGWPIARGGSQSIADAMASYVRSRGGVIQVGHAVATPADLPAARVFLFDVTPRQLARIAGKVLPAAYRERLEAHRHGPGVFKMDWAMNGPIPWTDPACARAATVHIGGRFDEIAAAERAVWNGVAPGRPFVFLCQPTLFDGSRAPAGMHIAWAYCHVPNGYDGSMTAQIESQVERFAPGFADRVVARHVMSPADMERHNPNYVGGDIAGGVQGFSRLFLRPLGQWQAYVTPVKGLYLCSSSMPPGAGVHGMCGHLAARLALEQARA